MVEANKNRLVRIAIKGKVRHWRLSEIIANAMRTNDYVFVHEYQRETSFKVEGKKKKIMETVMFFSCEPTSLRRIAVRKKIIFKKAKDDLKDGDKIERHP